MLLARISNLPTIWTNVLAGLALTTEGPAWSSYLWLAASMSCFYTGGMFLNDAFDRDIDHRERPSRPIPAGDVSASEVFGIGFALLAAGALLLVPTPTALPWGLALGVAIVVYDMRHKGSRLGPFVMGLCRGLVYCTVAAAVAVVTPVVLLAAAGLTAYVAGLTQVAKLAGASARWLVPALIAGISLVDAALVAFHAPLVLAAAAVLGFPLTLFLQRFVPGD